MHLAMVGNHVLNLDEVQDVWFDLEQRRARVRYVGWWWRRTLWLHGQEVRDLMTELEVYLFPRAVKWEPVR